MSEYIGGPSLVIDEGEEIPISVGARIIFHEDGEYLVSVHGGKISLRPLDEEKTK